MIQPSLDAHLETGPQDDTMTRAILISTEEVPFEAEANVVGPFQMHGQTTMPLLQIVSFSPNPPGANQQGISPRESLHGVPK